MLDFIKNTASTVVAFIVAGLIALAVIFFGTNIETDEFSINPSPDVVKISESALLVKQDASERATVLIGRNSSGALFSVCSEPPPDANQQIAKRLGASLSSSLQRGSDEGGLDAEALSELQSATQSTFDRSQGIQLLRDTMFRICEAFQNGVLTSNEYSVLMSQLIATANFIIPFEQCASIAVEVQKNHVRIAGEDSINPSVLIFERCAEAALNFNHSSQLRQLNALNTGEIDATLTDSETSEAGDE